MNGTWLLPTRKRTPILQRFLTAAVRTGMTGPGHVLVSAKEFYDDRKEYDKVVLPDNWMFEPVDTDCIVDTIRAAMPLYRHLDWVGLVTDDVVPETDGWEQKLLARCDGRTIVSCNDGSQAPRRMCGAQIYPLPLLRAVGYHFPKGFKHCFVDDIWETIGREAGCWHVRMDVMVRHVHPWITGQEDDTHRHSYSREFWDNDSAMYEQWKVKYKDESIRKAKEFLAKREAA